MSEIKISQHQAKFAEIKNYCHLSSSPNDFIEVTERSNGEGFDVNVSDSCRGDIMFSLTHGQFQLLNVLVNYKQ